VPNLAATLGLRFPPDRPRSILRAVCSGLLWGGAAALFGALYLLALEAWPPLQEFKEQSLNKMRLAVGPAGTWLAVLAILLAPPFEEFLFRGLLFRGIRRSSKLWAAVAGSAAIFAIVHPPISLVPVFAMGLAAALSFERTGILLAPIIVHVVYNSVTMLANLAI
jgi:membrane protease YdiL (CAAX protease family)